MRRVRRDKEIYRADGGWFRARWHFSFDRYRDPAWMGFGSLRVFNDDRLVPGAIWPMHPHRDVEGLTYVVEGTFRHEDDLGTGGILPAGSVQRMTLGSGALHSEQNASETEPMRFIQMWILPRTSGLTPSCEQRAHTEEDRTDTLLEVFSPPGGPGIPVDEEARVFVARLSPGTAVERAVAPGFGTYLYLISGSAEVGPDALAAGDAVAITEEERLAIRAVETSELIVVEVRA